MPADERARALTGKPVDVVLFDLGGVLVELGPSPVPDAGLIGNRGFSLADWFESDTAVAFEKGLIAAPEFARAMIEELDIDCSVDELIDHFTRWPTGLYRGADALLTRLRRDYRLAILTNTNELHWPRFSTEFGLPRYAEQIFASHRLGMVKPEAEIFEHVVATLDTAADRILFVDDHEANVDAARGLGLQAELVRGFVALEQTLAARGIIGGDG